MKDPEKGNRIRKLGFTMWVYNGHQPKCFELELWFILAFNFAFFRLSAEAAARLGPASKLECQLQKGETSFALINFGMFWVSKRVLWRVVTMESEDLTWKVRSLVRRSKTSLESWNMFFTCSQSVPATHALSCASCTQAYYVWRESLGGLLLPESTRRVPPESTGNS